MAVTRPEPEAGCATRVSHRAEQKLGKRTTSARYLLRCGDCDQALQIYYGPDDLEINGVYGSIENWREIFLPLLRVSGRGKSLKADAIRRKKPTSTGKPARRG
jgi:hypothetical protein